MNDLTDILSKLELDEKKYNTITNHVLLIIGNTIRAERTSSYDFICPVCLHKNIIKIICDNKNQFTHRLTCVCNYSFVISGKRNIEVKKIGEEKDGNKTRI